MCENIIILLLYKIAVLIISCFLLLMLFFSNHTYGINKQVLKSNNTQTTLHREP